MCISNVGHTERLVIIWNGIVALECKWVEMKKNHRPNTDSSILIIIASAIGSNKSKVHVETSSPIRFECNVCLRMLQALPSLHVWPMHFYVHNSRNAHVLLYAFMFFIPWFSIYARISQWPGHSLRVNMWQGEKLNSTE